MRQANLALSVRRALVALCVALIGVGVLAPAAHAAPSKSISEVVGPSIVFIRTIYKAYVEVPLRSGKVWTPEMSLTTTCTGYAVDTSGSIATAGHCVNGSDDEISNAFRQKTIELLTSELNWTDTEATANYKIAVSDKWPVSGSTSGATSAPSRSVSVQQPKGTGQVLTDWVDAQVIDYQNFADGDNAILRISNNALVPLAISPDEPQPGEAITAVGFPGAVRIVTDTSIIPQPSYKTGTVSSRQITGAGVTKTEISAGMGQGMSGGPTVDSDGNVIGTNSSVTKDETASFDFITDNIALRSYLESHGVQLAAPRGADATGSTTNVWLWLGPAIGVVVLIVILVAVVLIRRSRRRRTPGGPGYPTGPSGPGGQFGPAPQGQRQFGPAPRQQGFGQPTFGQSGGPRPGPQQYGPSQGGVPQGGAPSGRPGPGFGGPPPQQRPQQPPPFRPNPAPPRPGQQGPPPQQQQPGRYPQSGPGPSNPGPQSGNPYPPNPFR